VSFVGERIIRSFMDIIILRHLKSNHSISGYDIIKYLHRKFSTLPSPGTVYSLLYSLERQDLIEGSIHRRRRVYRLTEKGEKFLEDIGLARKHLERSFAVIFSEG